MKNSSTFPNLPKAVFEAITIGDTTHAFGSGDCLEVMPHIPKGSVDLIITDPPYNRNINYGKTFKDRMKPDEYTRYINDRIEKSIELLKDSGSMYIITYPELAVDIFTMLKPKMTFKRWLTWHYPTNIGHSKKNFTRSQRTILFFTKTKKDDYIFNRDEALMPYKNPTDKRVAKLMKKSKGRMAYDAGAIDETINSNTVPDDFITLNLSKNITKDRQKWHKCQLPLELISFLVKISSNKGSVILDPFAGTFSLNTVALDLGRHSIGIDINPEYAYLGIERITNLKSPSPIISYVHI